MYKLWSPGTVVVAGGFDRASALKVAEETEQLVAFGRPFLANVSALSLWLSSLTSSRETCMLTRGPRCTQPDLVFRLRENIPLTPDEEDSYYLPMDARGYTTYPFSEQWLKQHGEKAQL